MKFARRLLVALLVMPVVLATLPPQLLALFGGNPIVHAQDVVKVTNLTVKLFDTAYAQVSFDYNGQTKTFLMFNTDTDDDMHFQNESTGKNYQDGCHAELHLGHPEDAQTKQAIKDRKPGDDGWAVQGRQARDDIANQLESNAISQLDLDFKPQAGSGDCVGIKVVDNGDGGNIDVKIQDARANYSTQFIFTDQDTAMRTDRNGSWTFAVKDKDHPNIMYKNDEYGSSGGSCPSFLAVQNNFAGTPVKARLYNIKSGPTDDRIKAMTGLLSCAIDDSRQKGLDSGWNPAQSSQDCIQLSFNCSGGDVQLGRSDLYTGLSYYIDIGIGGTDKLGRDSNGNVIPPTPSDTTNSLTGSNAHVDCEVSGTGIFDAPISWLLCPLVDGAQGIVNTVGGWVIDKLEINTKEIFGPATANGTNGVYEAWNAFRVISMSLLVLIALVAIFSQALGIELIDAYTIRKVLPRMLLAIVAITLSWDLSLLAINISNAMGVAVRAIIDTPFKSLPNPAIDPLLILGATAGAGGLLSVLGLLSFVGTAALAVLFAFIFTILRLGGIIALVIFAPVAILCSILPNTQKGWKLWHEGLSGALLMFPIVTAFLAIGAAFGKIMGNIPGHQHDPVNQAIALIATYAPYFLIPKAFSLAGGLVGTLTGMANDRGRGAFDRLRKFRQAQPAKQFARAREGNFFRGGRATGVRARLNQGLQAGTLAGQAGFNPRNWRSNLASARAKTDWHDANQLMQEDEDFTQIKDIDHLLDAARTQTSRQGIESSIRGAHARNIAAGGAGLYSDEGDLREQVSMVNRLQQRHGLEAVRVASTMQLAATGTGYRTSGEMLQAIDQTAGNDRSLANRMLGSMRGAAMQSRRSDLGGAGMVPMMHALEAIHTHNATPAQATQEVLASAINSNGPGAFVGNRVESVRQYATHLNQQVQDAFATGDLQVIDRTLASVAGTYDTMSQVSPENAGTLADLVMSQNVTDPQSGAQATIQQAIEFRRVAPNNQNFLQMRREYGTNAMQGYLNQQQQQMIQQMGPQQGQGGGPGPVIQSDRRLKRNIALLSTTDTGIKLYRFQYLWSDIVYVGVMAQDLVDSHPEVLSTDKAGFYRVNYALLGLEMLTIEEWTERQKSIAVH